MIQFAKKTGDYSVLSTADLCVLALTYALEQKEIKEEEKHVDEKVPILHILPVRLCLTSSQDRSRDCSHRTSRYAITAYNVRTCRIIRECYLKPRHKRRIACGSYP